MEYEPATTDIIPKLRYARDNLDSIRPEVLAAILDEAIKTMRDMRILMQIRDEVMLEDAEPKGRA